MPHCLAADEGNESDESDEDMEDEEPLMTEDGIANVLLEILKKSDALDKMGGNSEKYYRGLYIDFLIQTLGCSRRVFHNMCFRGLTTPFRGSECNCTGWATGGHGYAIDELGEIFGGIARAQELGRGGTRNLDRFIRDLTVLTCVDPITQRMRESATRKLREQRRRFRDTAGHKAAVVSMINVAVRMDLAHREFPDNCRALRSRTHSQLCMKMFLQQRPLSTARLMKSTKLLSNDTTTHQKQKAVKRVKDSANDFKQEQKAKGKLDSANQKSCNAARKTAPLGTYLDYCPTCSSKNIGANRPSAPTLSHL